MIVQSFLKWSETAKTGDRARAAFALAQAYSDGRMQGNEAMAAAAALAFLLEDPSPKVRIALAEGLAHSDRAPRSVILALASDQIEVASRVIALSPVLTESDLVDLVAGGRSLLQQIVAFRRPLGVSICAALAEVGSAAAVADLLENAEASIARISLRRIAERFGDNAEIRSLLFERPDLPCAVRQGLVEKVGAALAGFGLVRTAIGSDRVLMVTDEACVNATLRLAETVDLAELPALVEHLRITGRLTPAFLMHGLCAGNVDFFAAAVVALSGLGENRVRGILVDGRETGMRALYRAIGLDGDLATVFVSATLMWREASRRGGPADAGAIAARLIARHGDFARDRPAIRDLLRLVESMQHAWTRQGSRDYATALAAQAA
ncbi:uncharacterized protein (DUF2336 family) [Hoeflea marina]|uniref:Uncharacterized protein (DUF2336 family) n=1 Tax=Hoeflea marina TaxID=274592 RepID=A0A317PR72_9HYPH|nr:DUF2336 domain-containing protein [Hoeflea marina]PWW03972.1 uncharacterized protein (DUF2336 family) [Hoeflea marina]